MKDRLKIRVWDKRKNNYIEDFVFNFINKSPYITVEYFDNEYAYTHTFEEDEIIIEQCTGLKDKNGKLIYEGDIVKLNGKYEIDVYPIVYDESCCEYILTKNDKFIYEFYWEIAENCEVIGNIHENKDLLESNNEM